MRDAASAPLKAAGVAAFVVGVVLFLINPPSLSGAGGLMALIGGAIALIVVTAWIAVALTGRDSMSEREFDRLLERSERLAREGEPPAAPSDFDVLVTDAIDALPREFQELLERTPVVVSFRGHEYRAYGHYWGDTVVRDSYPDRIVIYQDTLERDFGHDPALLRAQVERTLRHELAHHLGWKEPGVRELGL
ncbi:MAG: metallopeptidase family protein [Thermoleophilaceae bacterium]|jgi:predicted Zn-dependent protease with MMP-like domain